LGTAANAFAHHRHPVQIAGPMRMATNVAALNSQKNGSVGSTAFVSRVRGV
jgi:hypothetical protein